MDKNIKKAPESEKSKSHRVIKLRNRFFFMLYRYSTLVFLSSMLCLGFSIAFLVIFTRQPVPPQYIPVTEDGRYIKLEPLSVCKEDVEVQRFMLNAIKKLYTYDYINYADQIQQAAPFFTVPGWDEYLDAYGKSNTLFAVKQNKWIVSIKPTTLPSVISKEVINNVCTWDTKMNIQVSYIGGSGQQLRGNIYMRIVRSSVINTPMGLSITKAIFEAEEKN